MFFVMWSVNQSRLTVIPSLNRATGSHRPRMNRSVQASLSGANPANVRCLRSHQRSLIDARHMGNQLKYTLSDRSQGGIRLLNGLKLYDPQL